MYNSTYATFQWNGFFYGGLLRGIAEIALSTSLYTASEFLIMLSFAEAGYMIPDNKATRFLARSLSLRPDDHPHQGKSF